jgi:pyruvate carboxylase
VQILADGRGEPMHLLERDCRDKLGSHVGNAVPGETIQNDIAVRQPVTGKLADARDATES